MESAGHSLSTLLLGAQMQISATATCGKTGTGLRRGAFGAHSLSKVFLGAQMQKSTTAACGGTGTSRGTVEGVSGRQRSGLQWLALMKMNSFGQARFEGPARLPLTLKKRRSMPHNNQSRPQLEKKRDLLRGLVPIKSQTACRSG